MGTGTPGVQFLRVPARPNHSGYLQVFSQIRVGMPAHKKPSAVLQLTGATKRDKTRYKDRKHDPVPPGMPKATKKLTGKALETWKRVIPQLIELNLATALDSEALTQMCQVTAEVHEAIDSTEKNRETRLDRATKRWLAFSAKFGMTPSDRVGLGAVTGKKQTKLEQLTG